MGPCWLRVERAERVSTGIVSPSAFVATWSGMMDEKLGIRYHGARPNSSSKTQNLSSRLPIAIAELPATLLL
jgi:hypothetical protein